MRSLFALALTALLLLLPSVSQSNDILNQNIYDATAALVVKQADNDSAFSPKFRHEPYVTTRPLCTASVYRRIENGYRMVTAAHCFRTQPLAPRYVRFEGEDPLPIQVVAIGDLTKGVDVAIFDVTTDRLHPVLALGTETTLTVGEKVVMASYPDGLEKQLAIGHVSRVKNDEPIYLDANFAWYRYFRIYIDSVGGCSGSPVVSTEQGAIVGVLVGGTHYGSWNSVIVVPISYLYELEK